MRPSLTGSSRSDAQVPVAMALVGAVREFDAKAVAEVLDGADLPALAVVLAAMVPWDQAPGQLLAWCLREGEYHRLAEAGVDEATAATIVDEMGKRAEVTHEVWERRAPAGRWEVVFSGKHRRCRDFICQRVRRGTPVRFAAPTDLVALPVGEFPAVDTTPDGTVAP